MRPHSHLSGSTTTSSLLTALLCLSGLVDAAPTSPSSGHFLQSRSTLATTTTPSSLTSKTNVTLPCGTVNVTGITSHLTNVTSFRSIPFAEPPVGSLRFAPPQTYVYANNSVVDATQQGPACIQIPTGSLAGTHGISEDCLTLNVFTPSNVTPKSGLSVFVWIYGGGFIEGSTDTYDPSAMIIESQLLGAPIVFVAMNYRLSIYGFAQGAEAAENGAANLGLLDQLEALRWVQTNIARFGGDPKKVVVGGESAGAISASLHLLNPNVDVTELFRGVIMESGAPSTYSVADTSVSRQGPWDSIAELSGCTANATAAGAAGSQAYNTIFQCLQYAPSSVLQNATLTTLEQPSAQYGNFIFGPSIDGTIIPDSPWSLLREGAFQKLPFISGNNLDEGTIFSPPPPIVTDTASAVNYIDLVLPTKPDSEVLSTLFEYYSDYTQGSPFGTGNNTFGLGEQFKVVSALSGDVNFQAPRREFIQQNIAHNNGTEDTKAWSYLFTENLNTSSPAGVSHGSEVPFVFGAPVAAAQSGSSAYPPTAVQLSTQMVAYWLNFINYLDPNGDGGIVSQTVAKTLNLTQWPEYSAGAAGRGGANMLQLHGGNVTVIQDTFRAEAMEYINSLGPVISH